jgi:Fe-S-cluster-containing dehydrogenase component
MRCNGCVISCKRTWKMKGIVPADNKPNQKVTFNQRVVIKPQRRVDTAPFIRYSCWHCPDPPCVRRCPWKAIYKDPTGPVNIDPALCDPQKIDPATGLTCGHVCQTDCGRGGYPKIGAGSSDPAFTSPKAWKCTMCFGRAGSPTAEQTAKYGFALPSKAEKVGSDWYSPFYPSSMGANARIVPELAHQPSCVYTCPAKAMGYDTKQNIVDYLNWHMSADPVTQFPGVTPPSDWTAGDAPWTSVVGDGGVFWFSRKYFLIQPKADPFMEDHVSPMVGSLLSGPFAKAALVPTLVAGGLLALAARRARIQEEESLAGGEA